MRLSFWLCLLLAAIPSSFSATIHVPQEVSTIQAAIESATHGDEVIVSPGVYPEAVELIGQNIFLHSLDPMDASVVAATVITASGTEPRLRVQGVCRVEGFTITGGSTRWLDQASVLIGSGTPTVSYCNISDNLAPGVFIGSGVLSHCTISGNSRNGISAYGQPATEVIDCTISGNEGIGVECLQAPISIKRCSILENEQSGIAVIETQSLPTSIVAVSDCLIASNGKDGIDVLGWSNLSSASVFNCTIRDNTGSGVLLQGANALHVGIPCLAVINGSTMTGNGESGVHVGWPASAILTDCLLSQNLAGVTTVGSSDRHFHELLFLAELAVDRCRFEHNKSYGLEGAEYSVINCENSVVEDNPTGIHLYSKSSTNFKFCTIAKNYQGIIYDPPFFLPFPDDYYFHKMAALESCICFNKGFELQGAVEASYCCIRGGWPGAGNITGEPLFADPTHGDFHLLDGSACIDVGTGEATLDLDGLPRPGADGLFDIGAYESPSDFLPGAPNHIPQRLYVVNTAQRGGDGLSWETAFPTIAEGVAGANVGDEIWVQKGIFSDTFMVPPHVSLFGGFSGTETDRSQRGLFFGASTIRAGVDHAPLISLHNETLMDGFIVENTSTVSHGGGILCVGRGSRIANCTVRDCTGYGIQCASETHVENCLLARNYGSGLVGWDGSSADVRGCRFIGNGFVSRSWSRSAVDMSGADLAMTDCIVCNNPGGGVSVGSRWYPPITPSVRLLGCVISYNWGGGIHAEGLDLNVSNCVIADNSASMGGGGVLCWGPIYYLCDAPFGEDLCQKDAVSRITNCTIVRNSAPDGGGIYVGDQAKVIVTNSILFNEGAEIVGMAEVSYSDIEGGLNGLGNINQDPHFSDQLHGDFTLTTGSPCIDFGNPFPQFNDGCLPPGRGFQRNDMGAYGGPGNCDWPVPDGDLNLDGVAGEIDLLSLIGDWGILPSWPFLGDMHGDGRIDFYDLLLFMIHWKSQ
jgi:hypothetical protein